MVVVDEENNETEIKRTLCRPVHSRDYIMPCFMKNLSNANIKVLIEFTTLSKGN